MLRVRALRSSSRNRDILLAPNVGPPQPRYSPSASLGSPEFLLGDRKSGGAEVPGLGRHKLGVPRMLGRWCFDSVHPAGHPDPSHQQLSGP